MARRPDVLENTLLGVLSDGPLHGYELRKRVTAILGPFRALSYGSLYPCLHRLTDRGLIHQVDTADRQDVGVVASRRSRVVYALTAEGKEAFQAWVQEVGPEAWEDEAFAARFAFFSATSAQVRLRILEGRRNRLKERLKSLQDSIDRTQDRMDLYAERLQRHGIEGTEREVGWIDELIEAERGARAARKSVRAAAKSTAGTTASAKKSTKESRNRA